jgi:hypothetical protein
VAEPYPEGTRVHHRGAIHSVARDPEHPNGGLRGGWGAVLRSKRQGDGTYEYEVSVDRAICGLPYLDGAKPTWWGSHHIDASQAPAPVRPVAPSEEPEPGDRRVAEMEREEDRGRYDLEGR